MCQRQTPWLSGRPARELDDRDVLRVTLRDRHLRITVRGGAGERVDVHRGAGEGVRLETVVDEQ
jgi:hypothetical protein